MNFKHVFIFMALFNFNGVFFRMMESGNLPQVFLSSINVVKNTCRLARVVPWYQTVVLSYQLVLKLAEMIDVKLRREVIIFFSSVRSSRISISCLLWFLVF